MEIISKNNREPFARPLIKAGFAADIHGSILQVPGHPELVVGSLSLDIVKDPHLTVDMLLELDTDYDIAMPVIRPVIAEDQAPNHPIEHDRKRFYLICDRIDGEDLYRALSAGRVSEQETKGLWNSLIRYYGDKYSNREPFLDDLTSKFNQYKYGTSVQAPDEPPKIYLVDVGAAPVMDAKHYRENPLYDAEVNKHYESRAHGQYVGELARSLSQLGTLIATSEQITSFDCNEERQMLHKLLGAVQTENQSPQIYT